MRIKIVKNDPEESSYPCGSINHLIGQEFDVVNTLDYESDGIVYIDCEDDEGFKVTNYTIFKNEYEVVHSIESIYRDEVKWEDWF